MHCVAVREREGEILSGGEDGTVRIWGEEVLQSRGVLTWLTLGNVVVLMQMPVFPLSPADNRTGQCVHCIEVHKYEVC